MSADRPCAGLFITGTDTGVGKTVVTATLARYFTQRGYNIGVMKPCETGVADPGNLGDDARLLCWAANCRDSHELVSPYRFTEPLAPASAAERAGKLIDPNHIVSAFATLSQGKDLMLVEGAGGLMVPVRGGFLVADLIRQLNLPSLVIARPGLGTLNHTLLTIYAARTMALTVAGFMINRMPRTPGQAESEAPHLLASLASADLLGVLPEVSGTLEEQIETLVTALGDMPTLPWLTRAIGLDGQKGK